MIYKINFKKVKVHLVAFCPSGKPVLAALMPKARPRRFAWHRAPLLAARGVCVSSDGRGGHPIPQDC